MVYSEEVTTLIVWRRWRLVPRPAVAASCHLVIFLSLLDHSIRWELLDITGDLLSFHLGISVRNSNLT